jgi:hypothetical protein
VHVILYAGDVDWGGFASGRKRRKPSLGFWFPFIFFSFYSVDLMLQTVTIEEEISGKKIRSEKCK